MRLQHLQRDAHPSRCLGIAELREGNQRKGSTKLGSVSLQQKRTIVRGSIITHCQICAVRKGGDKPDHMHHSQCSRVPSFGKMPAARMHGVELLAVSGWTSEVCRPYNIKLCIACDVDACFP